jgi:hypothetical protein
MQTETQKEVIDGEEQIKEGTTTSTDSAPSETQSLVGSDEKTEGEKNLGSVAKPSEDRIVGPIFDVLDSLELDEESKTYIANQKKFHDGATEAGKKNIEKVLAEKFLSK